VVWDEEYKSLKKWSDLVSTNVTVTNSGKISLQETIIKTLVFTLASSRLNSIVYIFSRGLSRIIFAANWLHKKLKIEWF